jgi:hypothetical protein
MLLQSTTETPEFQESDWTDCHEIPAAIHTYRQQINE